MKGNETETGKIQRKKGGVRRRASNDLALMGGVGGGKEWNLGSGGERGVKWGGTKTVGDCHVFLVGGGMTMDRHKRGFAWKPEEEHSAFLAAAQSDS